MIPRKAWMKRSPKKAKEPGEKPAKRRKLEEMDFSDLVKVLDAEHSYHVRAGLALKQGHPWIKCYTCGKIDHWKRMDCGHWISRRKYGVRWDFRNTRPQCTTCNSYNEGEKDRFQAHLERDGVNVKAVRDLADMWGEAHPPKEMLLKWIKEYRVESARIRKEIAGMADS